MTALLFFALSLNLLGTLEAKVDLPSNIEAFIEYQAHAIGGEEVRELRKASGSFDFDGLRDDDMAVLYYIGKDNDATAFLAIFEEDNDRWHLTHQARFGGRGLRHITGFEVFERRIQITALEFRGGEPLSSPSMRVQISLTAEKGLLQIERETTEDE